MKCEDWLYNKKKKIHISQLDIQKTCKFESTEVKAQTETYCIDY